MKRRIQEINWEAKGEKPMERESKEINWDVELEKAQWKEKVKKLIGMWSWGENQWNYKKKKFRWVKEEKIIQLNWIR